MSLATKRLHAIKDREKKRNLAGRVRADILSYLFTRHGHLFLQIRLVFQLTVVRIVSPWGDFSSLQSGERECTPFVSRISGIRQVSEQEFSARR